MPRVLGKQAPLPSTPSNRKSRPYGFPSISFKFRVVFCLHFRGGGKPEHSCLFPSPPPRPTPACLDRPSPCCARPHGSPGVPGDRGQGPPAGTAPRLPAGLPALTRSHDPASDKALTVQACSQPPPGRPGPAAMTQPFTGEDAVTGLQVTFSSGASPWAGRRGACSSPFDVRCPEGPGWGGGGEAWEVWGLEFRGAG